MNGYGSAVTILTSETWQDTHADRAAALACDVISLWFKRGASKENPFSDVTAMVGLVLSYLAEQPSDSQVRTQLVSALDTEAAGLWGFALLRSVINGCEPPQSSGTYTSSDTAKASYTDLLEWFETFVADNGRRSRLLGHGVAPDAPTGVTDEALLQRAEEVLQHSVSGVESVDLRYVNLMLDACLALCDRTGDQLRGLQLIGIAASGLARNRHYQTARDLSEMCLLRVRSNAPPDTRRKAWAEYASIHLHCNSRLEAAAALAIARVSGVELPAEHAYYERMTEARLLREMHHYEEASHCLAEAATFAAEAGLPPVATHRTRVMSLAIELMMQVNDRTRPAAARREPESIVRIAKDLLDLNKVDEAVEFDAAPIVGLLAQCAGLLAGNGAFADTHRELIAAVESSGIDLSGMVTALCAPTPSIETFTRIVDSTQGARYALSGGHDATVLGVLARRLLSQSTLSEQETLYVLEWGTDRTIRQPTDSKLDRLATLDRAVSISLSGLLTGQESSAADLQRLQELRSMIAEQAEPWQPIQPAEPEKLAAFVGTLSKTHGAETLVVGLDRDDRLVAAQGTGNGILIHRDSGGAFSATQHRVWSRTYPYGYGKMDTSDAFGVSRVTDSLREMAAVGFKVVGAF